MYIIEIKVNNFNLNDSITSGQIFRYEKEFDNSYTLPLNDRIINIKQEGNLLFVNSNVENNLEKVVISFFDLDTDYNIYNQRLIEMDSSLESIINECKGFKIFKSYKFETIISFIISANNNVSNIKKSVDLLSVKYGEKIIWKNKEYYLFPNSNALKSITLEELKEMKLGFRSKYVYEMIYKVNSCEIDLEKIHEMNTKDAINYLTQYKGIGLKVASCILLFAYSKYDVFPIDTWVKKRMKELYDTDDANEIKKIIEQKYDKYSGIVIQYMYHYKRNKEKKL